MENGLTICKPYAIAECMNNFFTRKVQNLRANLPHSEQNPLNLVERLMNGRTCSFSLQPVHPDQVDKIISSLKSTRSCGLDNIDSSVIKLARTELVPVITHIINLSSTQKTFPVREQSPSPILPRLPLKAQHGDGTLGDVRCLGRCI